MYHTPHFTDIPDGKDSLKNEVALVKISDEKDLPPWAHRETLISFLHETMKPYEDSPGDINRGLDYVFSKEPGKGGFLVLAGYQDQLVGVLVMLDTGMEGYIPKNLLLFVSVTPELRGHGLGRRIIELATADLDGQVKLHVEYDNPAKRLYERIGFESKYAEMRLSR